MSVEEQEALAIDYLLGELVGDERRAFEAQLARDPALAAQVARLEETLGSLVLAAPPMPLPPALRERVLAAPRGEVPAAQVAAPRAWLPWSLAAGFALACGLLLSADRRVRSDLASTRAELETARAERASVQAERDRTRAALAAAEAESARVLERERFLAREARAAIGQNDELRATLATLRGRDTLAQMRIATLSAKLASFAQAGVTIVWDQEKQRGILQIANLPKLGPGKDYQLWVIDPKYPIPVNGGVVRAGSPAVSRVFFAPDQKVDRVEQFAITIERTGGVPKAEGPLVLAGS